MPIDAHIHLSQFSKTDVEKIISEAPLSQHWVMAGYDFEDWQQQIIIQSQFPQRLQSCFGLHPWRVVELSKEDIQKSLIWLEQNMGQSSALGELGLDLFIKQGQEKFSLQEEVFLQQLSINQKFNKPLVLHCVQAHELLLNHLRKEKFTGICHGFSGSFQTAVQYVDLGYVISVGRGVLRNGYHGLKETVMRLPLGQLVIESDFSPSDQGEKSTELFFKVAAAVAEIKKIDLDEVLIVTEATARKVFKINV